MAEPTYEEMKARLKELETRITPTDVSFRISQKGGVSVYGLSRMPFTLYYEQWLRLLSMGTELREFMEVHKSELKS